MSALSTIRENLRRTFEGEAWHGPSVLEILLGVAAQQAAFRPIPGAHTIWELVLHITTWESVVTRRLKGEAFEPSPEEDYPAVRNTGEADWKRTLESLRRGHEALVAAVAELPESRLNEMVPGKDYTVEFMLLGIIQHNLYHAGQLALLKKAVRP